MQSKHWAHYTSLVAALISALLALWKGFVWWGTHSLAVQASLIDSGLDACTSLINFWAIHAALRPADACHRYGHDKVEALASLGQAVLMVGLSAFVMWESLSGLLQGERKLEVADSSLYMMAASTLIALGLVVMQTIAGRRVNSIALKTDALHYRADVLTNAGVFITLWLGHVWLDGVVALGLAVYLCKSAWGLIQEAGHILMDGELENDVRERIRLLVLAHPDVKSLNHLRTRFSGQTQFIQLNVVLDGSLNLSQAHTIAHDLEALIQNDDTSISRDVTIHQEPME